MDDEALRSIDESLIHLRHLWTAPPRLKDPRLGSVEMSTVWVVDTLLRSPDAEQTISQIAASMGVAQSTASRLVARAEAAGTVTRAADAEDARRVTVRPTESGAKLGAAGLSFRLQKLTDATADWNEEDRTRFAELLRRFATSMEANA